MWLAGGGEAALWRILEILAVPVQFVMARLHSWMNAVVTSGVPKLWALMLERSPQVNALPDILGGANR